MENLASFLSRHSNFVLQALDQHEFIAKKDTKCYRKGVACSVAFLDFAADQLRKYIVCINGPVDHRQCQPSVYCQGRCACIHAEQKAIIQLAIQGLLRKPEVQIVLMSTYSPCTLCANLIVISGFTGVVVFKYLTEHDRDGVSILVEAGIPVISHSDLVKANDHTSEEQSADPKLS